MRFSKLQPFCVESLIRKQAVSSSLFLPLILSFSLREKEPIRPRAQKVSQQLTADSCALTQFIIPHSALSLPSQFRSSSVRSGHVFRL